VADTGHGSASGPRSDSRGAHNTVGNGQTEGQINKLKLYERQMDGRAKLDLLRARIPRPL
jgi:transposase